MNALGLDIGTTSLSAVVYGEGSGVLETRTVPNGTFLPAEDWARLQDPKKILDKASALVETLLERHPDICSIGVTGQMHGIMYLDHQADPVSPLFTWQDGRGDLLRDACRSWAETLSDCTGYSLSTGFGMVTHYYNLAHGLVPETASCLCTIGDYVAMKLAGRSAPRMDATNAASLGLFDLSERDFDRAALAKAGIADALLPETAGPPFLGRHPSGAAVFTAIGDNQAAFLGSAGHRQDALLINVGTGSQAAIFSPVCLRVPGLETRPFPDGGWLLVGASLCGGRSYALLEQFFRQTVKLVTGSEDSVYDAMDQALSQTGRPNDLPRTLTTFQGTRQDAALRGSILDIGTDNFTPVHLMYSFMEGMAQELYGLYQNYLAAGGPAPRVLIGSGNGLRKNRHLCRAFERVFGCPLVLSPNAEEAAAGAAIYALAHSHI